MNSQASNINHYIISGKVVQDIALSEVAEAQVAAQCHDQAGKHTDASTIVGHSGKTIHRGCLE